MITSTFSRLLEWIAGSRVVQWVLGVCAFLLGLILWGERREGQGRRSERLKARERDLDLKERASESAIEIIEAEKNDANQALEAGERAARAEPYLPDSMSDEEYRLTFGRDRPSGADRR